MWLYFFKNFLIKIGSNIFLLATNLNLVYSSNFEEEKKKHLQDFYYMGGPLKWGTLSALGDNSSTMNNAPPGILGNHKCIFNIQFSI